MFIEKDDIPAMMQNLREQGMNPIKISLTGMDSESGPSTPGRRPSASTPKSHHSKSTYVA